MAETVQEAAAETQAATLEQATEADGPTPPEATQADEDEDLMALWMAPPLLGVLLRDALILLAFLCRTAYVRKRLVRPIAHLMPL